MNMVDNHGGGIGPGRGGGEGTEQSALSVGTGTGGKVWIDTPIIMMYRGMVGTPDAGRSANITGKEKDMDGKIVSWAVYGKHIPLYCVNHPEMRWSTKNIAPIGARNIFFAIGERECDCPCSDLRPVPQDGIILDII